MAHAAPILFPESRPQTRVEAIAAILYALEQNETLTDAYLDIFSDLPATEALKQRDLLIVELSRLRKQTASLIVKLEAEHPKDARKRIRDGALLSFVCLLVTVSLFATCVGLVDIAHYCASHVLPRLIAFVWSSPVSAATSAVVAMALFSALSSR